MTDPESPVGRRFELRIGPVAHGGHFVARHEGQVVFVRHALPGESVTVQITEDDGRFLRGDAVEVHAASVERVAAPCPWAGPGLCGGCDFQHVTLEEQRRLKAAVVEEQLSRLAGLEREVTVEAVPPYDGLEWRSRMQYVHLPDGGIALRKHRSHDLVAIDRCLIAHPDAIEPGPGTVTEVVDIAGRGAREFVVAADGFWQPHVVGARDAGRVRPRLPAAAAGGVRRRPVRRRGTVRVLPGRGGGADRVGRRGRGGPHGLGAREVEPRGVRVGQVRRRPGRPGARPGSRAADLVVLDPPQGGCPAPGRAGDGRPANRAPWRTSPATPPPWRATSGYFAECGYALVGLRAFDLFPMTHHVECVALLEPEEGPR